MNKRLKLPNGFGSITKKSGRRRRPFEIRKWIDGRQKVIGYEASYESALAFLCEYNKNPLLYSPSEITFSELFTLVKAYLYPRIKPHTQQSYTAAYNHLKRLYEKQFAKIRIGDLQATIRDIHDTGAGYSTQKKARQVLHHMYTYAVKYEIIPPERDISRYVDIDKDKKVYKKTIFNTRQIYKLFRASDNKYAGSNNDFGTSNNRYAGFDNGFRISNNRYAKMILMHMMLGTRPSEFLNIERSDVKIRQRYVLIRESKTEAGRNRIIPIHRQTLPYWIEFLSETSKYIATDINGARLNYSRFRTRFDRTLAELKIKRHTPHECRHTLASLLNNADANPTAIKRILGHASSSVTEKHYTHKDLHQLKKAMDLIVFRY